MKKESLYQASPTSVLVFEMASGLYQHQAFVSRLEKSNCTVFPISEKSI
jgi:hypothetical protein